MQKTKLGVSVGLLGAAVYFTCLFSGYLVPFILTGYILLHEDNAWLKKSAVQAVALMTSFSFLTVVIRLTPDAIGFIGSIFAVFGGSFHLSVISSLIAVVLNALSIIETVLFVILGVKALDQGSVSIPIVDDLINKYM